MVIDMGGGTSDIAVLSLGDIVASESVRLAGDQLNSDIAEYIGLSLPRTRAILKEIPDVSPIGNNSNRKWTLQK